MRKIIFCIIFISVSLQLSAEENYNWLTEYHWFLQDGRSLAGISNETADWFTRHNVKFRKMEIPLDNTFYQYRLRRERFTLMYQTEDKNKLYEFESDFSSDIYDVRFNSDLTRLLLVCNGIPQGGQSRNGIQINPKYPLIGIWGSLPYLTEYRLVDPANCIYYMEIDNQIPGWAYRKGTYLLKQTGDNVFETVSSFPDGRLRLEIINEEAILLTALFTLPNDERGHLTPLAIYRSARIQEN